MFLVNDRFLDLNATSQKMVVFLIDKVDDKNRYDVEFSCKEFMDYLGFADTGGKRIYLQKCLMDLRNTAIWIEQKDGSQVPFSWIDGTPIVDVGIIKVKLNKLITPFIAEYKTQINEGNYKFMIYMKSKYSIRLYELLKILNAKNACTEIKLDRLKYILSAEEYKKFHEFKTNVLDVVQEDLRKYMNYSFDYSITKKSKRIDGLKFLCNVQN